MTKNFLNILNVSARSAGSPPTPLPPSARSGSCGGNLGVSTMTTILNSHPTYGQSDYSNDINCTWTLSAPANKIIHIRLVGVKKYIETYSETTIFVGFFSFISKAPRQTVPTIM